jgi:2-aminoethylphosphonate-pyruvate transaminase
MVERSLRQLQRAGIREVVIGTGYLAEQYVALAARVGGLRTVFAPHFASTGSAATLAAVATQLGRCDFLLLESDLLYEQQALDQLLGDPRADVLLTSGRTYDGDEVFIQTDGRGIVQKLSKDERQLSRIDGTLVGISKVSADTAELLLGRIDRHGRQEYEHVFQAVGAFSILRSEDLAWCEIDDDAQLDRALSEIVPKIRQRDGWWVAPGGDVETADLGIG